MVEDCYNIQLQIQCASDRFLSSHEPCVEKLNSSDISSHPSIFVVEITPTT